MDFIRRALGSREPVPEPDAESPGWDAIDRHLAALYPGLEPQHWGTIIGWRLGGPDPLDGVSAYDSSGPPRHWHYVTYGLSELFEKESDDATRSGWGIELTFRLALASGDDEAPMWPVPFLQNLARYIFDSGNVLWPGHHMNANGPIALETDTALTAAVFVEDPELGSIDTPHGSVRFVQVVGITTDEYEAIRRWNTDSMVDLLRRDNPLLVSDLARTTILANPVVAAEVEAGRGRDGSSMAGVFVDRLAWSASDDALAVTIGAAAVDDWQIMLEGRVCLGREAFLEGPDRRVDLVPGDAFGWHAHADEAIGITLPMDLARRMSAIEGMAGEHRWPEAPGLTLIVEPTVITDQDGKEVGRLG